MSEWLVHSIRAAWIVTPTAVRTKNRIVGDEPLAVEYDLHDWIDIQPAGGSMRKIGIPHNIPISTRGLLRATVASTTGTTDDDQDDPSSPNAVN